MGFRYQTPEVTEARDGKRTIVRRKAQGERMEWLSYPLVARGSDDWTAFRANGEQENLRSPSIAPAQRAKTYRICGIRPGEQFGVHRGNDMMVFMALDKEKITALGPPAVANLRKQQTKTDAGDCNQGRMSLRSGSFPWS